MLIARVFAILMLFAAPALAAPAPDDPYIWLEDVNAQRSLDRVRAENAKTAAVLEKDPRYQGLYKDALTIAQAKDRIPGPALLNGGVFNFWQDADHVRGIWRRTTLTDYRTANPHWTTVIDLDALAAAEKANWFLSGIDCEEPRQVRCLVYLSDGGEDAVSIREFDLRTSAFVPSGFALPRGKQNVAWENENTLLIAREWNKGEVTTSGYPFIVKRLKRGQPLSAAKEIFRGAATDAGGTAPYVIHNSAGYHLTLIARAVTTFESETYLVTGDKVAKLAVPLKSTVTALLGDQVIVSLSEDWNVAGAHFAQGALVSLNLAEMKRDPAHLKPTLIYAPGPRESLSGVAATKDKLVVTILENVRGRAFVYEHGKAGWTHRKLDLPDNLTIGVTANDLHSNNIFIGGSGFLLPASLWFGDAKTGALEIAKTSPARFDASGKITEQFEAVSSDGTKIPYFVVHPANMKLDGSNPTILYAYGGFEVSETPAYSGTIGKLWLEKGGVYVLANIRGGGEFGPAWHEAGLKTKRQIIYDDFAAIGRDLIARKITSPRRLGIMGGSNGGLLMGVEFNQHPELWNAVDIQVPLLDMMRYEQIAAGASWVGEYGSMSVPEEAKFLASISPYANIKRGVKYPQPLIWTTTKDDRVGPQQARKFAARLSEYGIPYLYYEVIEGGHGSGANQEERAHTNALEMTYFTQKLID